MPVGIARIAATSRSDSPSRSRGTRMARYSGGNRANVSRMSTLSSPSIGSGRSGNHSTVIALAPSLAIRTASRVGPSVPSRTGPGGREPNAGRAGPRSALPGSRRHHDPGRSSHRSCPRTGQGDRSARSTRCRHPAGRRGPDQRWETAPCHLVQGSDHPYSSGRFRAHGSWSELPSPPGGCARCPGDLGISGWRDTPPPESRDDGVQREA